MTILKDADLKRVRRNVKPDSKKRVVLPGALIRDDIVFNIYCNSLGQILLDPQVLIPASEVWLFQNPEAIASIERGIEDAKAGRVSKVDLNDL